MSAPLLAGPVGVRLTPGLNMLGGEHGRAGGSGDHGLRGRLTGDAGPPRSLEPRWAPKSRGAAC